MRTFRIALTRTYLVSIKAENQENAKSFSEFYLGDCSDMSTLEDRLEKKFAIDDIEIMTNDATEIMEINTRDE